MNAKFVVTAVSLAVCFVGVSLFSEDRPKATTVGEAADESPQSDEDKWMAIKLTSSQQIIEHLTRGDFKQLETSARRMLILNFLEQWTRRIPEARQSDYQGQLNVFEFATKELVRNAHDQNLEGSLQAYLKLTTSCVHCHELIRDGSSK